MQKICQVMLVRDFERFCILISFQSDASIDHFCFSDLFRGKILVGGFVLKTLSEEPPRIRTTYITHVDLQGR